MRSRSTHRVPSSGNTRSTASGSAVTPLVLPALPRGTKALTCLLQSLQNAGGPPVCVAPGIGEKNLEKLTTLLKKHSRYRLQPVRRTSRLRSFRVYVTAAPGSLQTGANGSVFLAESGNLSRTPENRPETDWDYLQNIFSNMEHIAVQAYEADGTVRYWNRASEQLYGYPAASALGKNILDLIIPPAQRQKVRKDVRDFVKKGKPIPAGEVILQHQNGSQVPVFSHHSQVRMADGQPLMLSIDISLAEQVRQHETLTRTGFLLLESVKEQTCLYRVSQLSAASSDPPELLLQAAGLIPTGWQFPDDTLCRIRFGKQAFYSQPFQRPGPGMTEIRQTADGKRLEISVFVKRGRCSAEKKPFLETEYPLLRAIADLLVLQLSQLYHRHRSALHLSLMEETERIARIGSWNYDVASRQLICSEVLYDLFGLDRETFERNGGSFFLYVDPPERKKLRRLTKNAIREGTAYHLEYWITTARGERRFIREEGYGEKSPAGNVIRVFGTAQDITDRSRAEKELLLSEEKYRRLFNASPLPKFIISLKTKSIRDANEKALLHYGYTREEFIGMSADRLRPPEEIPRFHQILQQWEQTGENHISGKFVHCRKDGTRMDTEINAQRILFEGEECVMAISYDVTQRNRLEASESLERRVLERSIDPAVSAQDLFDDYLREISRIFPALSVSILRVINGRVYTLSAPNLPAGYLAALEGMEIGPCHGSCGTAAYTGKRVISGDIATDPYWVNYRALALPHGLRACWSQPIFSTGGEVIATFAMYYPEPREPGEDELKFFSKSAYLVSLILSSYEKSRALAQSNERYEYVIQATSEAIWDLDLLTGEVHWGEGFNRLFGLAAGKRVDNHEQFLELVHPEDRGKIESLMERVVRGTETVISDQYRIRRANGEYAYVSDRALVVRDDKGKPLRVIGSVQDITEKKMRELQLELMERIIVNASDAVVVTEVSGSPRYEPVITYVNEAFVRMTGYPEAELLGQSPRLLQGPKTDKDSLRLLQQAVEGNKITEATLVNYRKSGEEFWNNIRIYPVPDSSGKTSHWIAIERDVSAQQYKLQHAELMDRLAGIFGQQKDLRTVLAEVLSEICRSSQFRTGGFWLLSEDHRHLLPVIIHDPDQTLAAGFSDKLRQHRFEYGEGIPGRIWEASTTLVFRDMSDPGNFTFYEELRAWQPLQIVGIPVLHNKELLGVLVLGNRATDPQVAPYANHLEGMETFLGAEISRKKMEYELSLIFNTVPDLITVAGLDGYLKKINPAFRTLLGYSEEELLQRPFTDFVHPDDKALVLQDLQDLQGVDKQFYYELRGITRAGKVVWLAWSATSFYQEGLIFGVAKDITSQKELQQLLDRTNSMALIGTWDVDMQTGIIHLSEITRSILEVGSSFEQSLGNASSFFREDVRELAESNISQAVLTGTPFDFELPIVTQGGNEKWVRCMGETERADGRCIRLYGNLQDITKIKNAELRLQQSTDNIPGMLYQYFLFPDGTDAFRNVSKGAERLLGLRPNDYSEDTSPVWARIVEDDRHQLQASILESARTLGKWNQQWRMRHADGHMLWLEGHATPQRLANGTVYWDTAVFDITENKRMEALVQDATHLARIGAWQLESSSGTLMLSDMLHQILDLSQVPATLEQLFILRDPGQQRQLQEYIRQARIDGHSWDMEALLQTHGGSERWVRIIGNPEFIEGQCIRIQGSCQDIHERKTAALELEASYRAVEKFRQALNQSTNLVITDKQGYILEVNDRTCELSGYTREELIGQHTRINKSGVHDPAFFEMMWQTISAGKIWRGEIQNRGKNGTLYWVDTIIVPIRAESGEIEQYMALRIDITGRKQAEQALQKAYEERNSILESIGDAFFAVDRELRVTYWNKEAERIIGVQRDEILGQAFADVFPAAFERIYTQHYQAELGRGKSHSSEEYLPVLDKWIEISAYPSENGFSVYFKDITSRKQSLELLRISNERFEKVTEATNDAIWDWDIEQNTIYRGGGFRSIFGYQPGTATPASPNWHDHVHPDDQERLAAIIAAAIDDETVNTWQAEYRFRRSDDYYAYVVDRGLVIRNDQGRAVRMVGAIMDITYRKEYEQSLQQLNESLEKQAHELGESNAQLEQFAYVASHDLQEPLRMVTSFLAQLEKRYHHQLDDKARQYIGFATDGASRMRNMILALLEYSRVGRTHKQTEPVDLQAVVDEIKLLQAQLIGEKGAQIECSPLPVIRSNRISILQLFNNLVSNALKFSADDRPPLIRIQARETDTHWQFSVEDNGIGIEREYYERIFVIFQRLHNRERFEGTGMGLAIVKKIVETLGGRIWLESKPGEGTTFFFTLAKPLANTP